ncbi:outer membrane insertion C- signal [bacterium]|nr:outer membrane insertion C- signal [bacterium]
MKKLFLNLCLIVSAGLSAQEVGIRFGNVSGNNVAVDGVFSVGDWSRIHANASFGDGLGLDALWDFVDKPIGGEAFSWYAGVGPSMYAGNELFLLGASGEIGLEYHFNTVPFALGLDYRPTFWILEETEFEFGGFGLNVRYVF